MKVPTPHGGGLSPLRLRHPYVKGLHEQDIGVLPLDFETYFDKEVTLSKMPTTLYVRHPKFKVHGCGLYYAGEYYWLTGDQMFDFFSDITWEHTAVLAHNCPFDAFILSEYFSFTPAYYLDTAAMSRGLRGTNACHTLNCLADHFDFGQKIENTLDSTQGLEELTPHHLEALGEYCIQDVNLMIQCFDKMMDMGYPEKERHIISLTTKAFADPKLMVDPQLCIEEIEAEQLATSELLKLVGLPATELSSNAKFADLLRARGVEPPTKENDKGQTIYAFSKADESFLALERNPRVSILVQARRRVKSRIGETRAYALMAQGRPTFPVPMIYCGAHTHRWTGGGGVNVQSLPAGRKGQSDRLRRAIRAPSGWKLIQSDSSQIECVTGDSLILTQRGEIPIIDVTTADLVWDGVEWVHHGGVVFKGYREVLTYESVTATPEHIVFTRDDRTIPISQAEMEKAPLLIGARGGKAVRALVCPKPSDTACTVENYRLGLVQKMQFRTFSSVVRFAKREVQKLLREVSPSPTIFSAPSSCSCSTSSEVQRNTRPYKPSWGQSCLQILSQKEYRKPFLFLRAVCGLRLFTASLRRIFWFGGRPYRQRRALRTWEYTDSNSRGQRSKTRSEPPGRVSGGDYERPQIHPRSEAYIPPFQCYHSFEERPNPSRDHSSRPEAVYDIINSGPRYRFCCNGVIVSNCRVAARMAEQWDLLEAFAGGRDPYIDLAEEIFGYKVNKKDPERSVGKQGILSFQYGVGWKKYLSSVRVGTQGPPYELEEHQAIKAVRAYRSKYSNITATWNTLDQALDRMTVPGCSWEPIPYVRFEHRRVRMPNKLRIYYPGLEGMDYGDGRLQYEYQSRHGLTKIYGGAFFENLVQSVARTIVAEQALEIAKRYPDVVLLVHDEVVFLAPEEEAEDALRFSLDCLSTPPHWCEDLPLAAEGYISDHYKK